MQSNQQMILMAKMRLSSFRICMNSFARKLYRWISGTSIIIYVYLRWNHLSRSILEARNFRQCKNDETRLNNLWKFEYSKDNPLLLGILSIGEIRPTIQHEYNHFNPSIKSKENGNLEVFWRVSDSKHPSQNDIFGEPIIGARQAIKDQNDYEDIICGELIQPINLATLIPKNQTLVEIAKVKNSRDNEFGNPTTNLKLFLEDPRLHPGTGDYFTAIARFGNYRSGLHNEIFTRMIIVNRLTGEGTVIHSKNDGRIEKNWVVIREYLNEIVLLKQSEPMVLVHFNLRTGATSSVEFGPTPKSKSQTNLNGGSPLVLVDDKFYIRVARQQFLLSKIGRVRINILVMHDLEFREIGRSQPFIFQVLGAEICNGLALQNDLFYFTWGENCYKMFLGVCNKDELISWFKNNLQV